MMSLRNILKILFNKKVKLLIIGLFLFVLLMVIYPFQKVEIGHLGVMYNNISGKITGYKQPGLHYVIPFVQDVTVYPINERTYVISRDQKNWNNGIDGSITTPTKDNQTISMDVTFLYSFEQEKLNDIYERFDGKTIAEIEKIYFDDAFRDAIINTVSDYTAYDVYSTKRQEIQDTVLAKLQEKYQDTGVKIKNVYIGMVRLSDELVSILRAEALAQAAIIEAQGKSDANKLLSDSLSETIIRYESLNKLSESLKLVVVPSGSNTEFDFSKLIEQILGTDNVE